MKVILLVCNQQVYQSKTFFISQEAQKDGVESDQEEMPLHVERIRSKSKTRLCLAKNFKPKREIRSKRKNRISCPFCDEIFVTRTRLLSHINRDHSDQRNDDPSVKTIQSRTINNISDSKTSFSEKDQNLGEFQINNPSIDPDDKSELNQLNENKNKHLYDDSAMGVSDIANNTSQTETKSSDDVLTCQQQQQQDILENTNTVSNLSSLTYAEIQGVETLGLNGKVSPSPIPDLYQNPSEERTKSLTEKIERQPDFSFEKMSEYQSDSSSHEISTLKASSSSEMSMDTTTELSISPMDKMSNSTSKTTSDIQSEMSVDTTTEIDLNNLSQNPTKVTDQTPGKCDKFGGTFTRQSTLRRHIQNVHFKNFDCKHCPEKFNCYSDYRRHFIDVHGETMSGQKSVTSSPVQGQALCNDPISEFQPKWNCHFCQESFYLKNNLTFHIEKTHIQPNPEDTLNQFESGPSVTSSIESHPENPDYSGVGPVESFAASDSYQDFMNNYNQTYSSMMPQSLCSGHPTFHAQEWADPSSQFLPQDVGQAVSYDQSYYSAPTVVPPFQTQEYQYSIPPSNDWQFSNTSHSYPEPMLPHSVPPVNQFHLEKSYPDVKQKVVLTFEPMKSDSSDYSSDSDWDSNSSTNDSKESKIRIMNDKKTDSFKCLKCDKSFNQKRSLANHENTIHLKPFRCLDCPESFGRKESLKRHGIIAHKSKASIEEFSCLQCSKILSSKSNLKRHVELIHDK